MPDILVLSGSIIPTVIGPVLSVTLWAAGVAVAALFYGKEVGLTNNVGMSFKSIFSSLSSRNDVQYRC